MNTVVYEQATGKILRVVFGPTSIAWMQHGEGEGFVLAGNDPVSDETHYVDLAEESVRAKTPFDPGLSTLTPAAGDIIAGTLPAPGWVIIESEVSYQRVFDADGDLQLQFNEPGDYRVTFELERHYHPGVMIHVA